MLKEVKPVPTVGVDTQTVQALEALLASAKKGDLKSVIYIDQYKDGKCGHGWAGRPDNNMLGQIEDCKFNIISQRYFTVQE
tara:strand:- start:1094 stop:1336 length:243 start_codon:yes stop_codon:yes gene_type:complete